VCTSATYAMSQPADRAACAGPIRLHAARFREPS
jgi:hypothetical protein